MVLLHGTLDVTIHEATDLPLTMSNKVCDLHPWWPTPAAAAACQSAAHARQPPSASCAIAARSRRAGQHSRSPFSRTRASQDAAQGCNSRQPAADRKLLPPPLAPLLAVRSHCVVCVLHGMQAAGIMKRVVCCNAGPTLVGSCDPYVCLGESRHGRAGQAVG